MLCTFAVFMLKFIKELSLHYTIRKNYQFQFITEIGGKTQLLTLATSKSTCAQTLHFRSRVAVRAARNFFGAAHVWNTQCLQRKRENERSSDPNCLQMAVEARGGYRVDIQDLSMEFNRTLSLIPEANQACESFIE